MALYLPPVPSGAVTMYGGATAPAGWLLCDGTAVSRTTYATLFAILSTTYGTGDGSTTFNLPNTGGVFVRGAGSQTISTIGYTGTRGSSETDKFQAHEHSIQGASSGIPASGAFQLNTNGNNQNNPTNGIVTATGGTAPRTSGTETNPANICLTYIIKI